jgi:hypothetical protein
MLQVPNETVIHGMFNMIDNSKVAAVSVDTAELHEEEDEAEEFEDDEDPEHTVSSCCCSYRNEGVTLNIRAFYLNVTGRWQDHAC